MYHYLLLLMCIASNVQSKTAQRNAASSNLAQPRIARQTSSLPIILTQMKRPISQHPRATGDRPEHKNARTITDKLAAGP